MQITIEVKLKSKETRYIGPKTDLFGNTVYQIAINKPPLEGKANKELVEFLAEKLKIPKSGIKIVKGMKGRVKVLEVDLDSGAEMDFLNK